MSEVLFGLLIVCFLPWIVARLRGAAATDMLFVFILLPGWTGIGWLFALHQACTSTTRRPIKAETGAFLRTLS